MTPSPPDNCGQVIADLTFVVDGSGSICDQDPDKLVSEATDRQNDCKICNLLVIIKYYHRMTLRKYDTLIS